MAHITNTIFENAKCGRISDLTIIDQIYENR